MAVKKLILKLLLTKECYTTVIKQFWLFKKSLGWYQSGNVDWRELNYKEPKLNNKVFYKMLRLMWKYHHIRLRKMDFLSFNHYCNVAYGS